MAKKYRKHFIASSVVKEEDGRTAYYKTLEQARNGNLVKIRRGVYASAEQLADVMIDLDLVVPGGILCLFSAWNLHHLATSLPQAYHVAVKRGRKITLPHYPAIALHHVSEPLLEIGAEYMTVSRYKVRVYNPERCVCDAVKYRNKVGMDVCAEVINSYLARSDRNISRLMDYAEKLRVSGSLKKYLEVKL